MGRLNRRIDRQAANDLLECVRTEYKLPDQRFVRSGSAACRVLTVPASDQFEGFDGQTTVPGLELARDTSRSQVPAKHSAHTSIGDRHDVHWRRCLWACTTIHYSKP
jgi:hypothetical protein